MELYPEWGSPGSAFPPKHHLPTSRSPCVHMCVFSRFMAGMSVEASWLSFLWNHELLADLRPHPRPLIYHSNHAAPCHLTIGRLKQSQSSQTVVLHKNSSPYTTQGSASSAISCSWIKQCSYWTLYSHSPIQGTSRLWLIFHGNAFKSTLSLHPYRGNHFTQALNISYGLIFSDSNFCLFSLWYIVTWLFCLK